LFHFVRNKFDFQSGFVRGRGSSPVSNPGLKPRVIQI